MRSVVWLLAGATLFVIVGFFLMRGVHRDGVQDARTAAVADSTGKLAQTTGVVAEGTAKVAEATQKLSGAVHDLSENARQDEQRLDQLEENSADLKQRVEAVEDYIPKRKTAIAYTLIGGDFAIVGLAKVAVAEAIMTNGAAPDSNSAAGLPVPADLHGQSLKETYVRAGGRVDMVFDAQSGVEGGVVSLIPDLDLAMRTGLVNWRCETPDYPEIQKYLPTCRYVGSN